MENSSKTTKLTVEENVNTNEEPAKVTHFKVTAPADTPPLIPVDADTAFKPKSPACGLLLAGHAKQIEDTPMHEASQRQDAPALVGGVITVDSAPSSADGSPVDQPMAEPATEPPLEAPLNEAAQESSPITETKAPVDEPMTEAPTTDDAYWATKTGTKGAYRPPHARTDEEESAEHTEPKATVPEPVTEDATVVVDVILVDDSAKDEQPEATTPAPVQEPAATTTEELVKESTVEQDTSEAVLETPEETPIATPAEAPVETKSIQEVPATTTTVDTKPESAAENVTAEAAGEIHVTAETPTEPEAKSAAKVTCPVTGETPCLCEPAKPVSTGENRADHLDKPAAAPATTELDGALMLELDSAADPDHRGNHLAQPALDPTQVKKLVGETTGDATALAPTKHAALDPATVQKLVGETTDPVVEATKPSQPESALATDVPEVAFSSETLIATLETKPQEPTETAATPVIKKKVKRKVGWRNPPAKLRRSKRIRARRAAL